MSDPTPPADLTPDEIARICHPLKQRAAMVRFLRAMKLTVRLTPEGAPLVNRRHYDEVCCGRALANGEADRKGPAANDDSTPNLVALHDWRSKRKDRNGKTAQGR